MTPGSRLGFGAVLGGVFGAMAGGPVGAALGLAAGAWLARCAAPTPTPDQKKIHAQAMLSTAPPTKLREAAKQLDAVGLGDPLRVRAALREKPDPQHRPMLQMAAAASDPTVVEAASTTFKTAGAHAAADLLQSYARGLRAVSQAGRS